MTHRPQVIHEGKKKLCALPKLTRLACDADIFTEYIEKKIETHEVLNFEK